MTDTILFNGRITTLDPVRSAATAVAIKDRLFEAVGDDHEIMRHREPKTVPEEDIKSIAAVLTVVAGRIVHGAQEFEPLRAALPPPMPDWSPIRVYGGYPGKRATHSYSAACSVPFRHLLEVRHCPGDATVTITVESFATMHS